MSYTVETKTDLTGSFLEVRVPQDQVDTKALRTIQADPPPFLVPFHHRNVDGYAEFTYRPGVLVKVQYFSGQRKAKEYLDLWSGLLDPLLQCDDWYMKPLSFVLDLAYVYYDNAPDAASVIRYLYIPTITDAANPAALKALVEALSRRTSTTDKEIENAILRAVPGFTLADFMRTLNACRHKLAPPMSAETPLSPDSFVSAGHSAPGAEPGQTPASADAARHASGGTPDSAASASQASGAAGAGLNFDIQIADAGAEKPTKGKKPGKEKKPPKEKKPLFGGKKDKNVNILLGSASNVPAAMPETPAASPVFAADGDVTVLSDPQETQDTAFLRLEGDKTLPPRILLKIEPGQSFSIGRFDVSLGVRQNDFEFDKSTKNVSRRHAVIERTADGGYAVMDLNSKAGTYVDGQKVPTGIPYPLHNGCSVSFGNAGANYVFEG